MGDSVVHIEIEMFGEVNREVSMQLLGSDLGLARRGAECLDVMDLSTMGKPET